MAAKAPPLFPMRHWLAISLVMLLGATGCGKHPDVKAEAAQLEKTFTAANPNALVTRAATAIREGDYAAGVIALEAVKQTPGMTAEQLMAVQRATLTVTEDLTARAERGDAKAKADLAAIERTRSQ
jgi:precorrin-6B methylase 1